MTKELDALISRIEKITAPDRELDAEIVMTLCPGATVGTYIEGDDGDVVFHASAIGIADKSVCPALTKSVDAILKLVPKGWRVYCLAEYPVSNFDYKWFAGLDQISGGLVAPVSKYKESSALALCLAVAICYKKMSKEPTEK